MKVRHCLAITPIGQQNQSSEELQKLVEQGVASSDLQDENISVTKAPTRPGLDVSGVVVEATSKSVLQKLATALQGKADCGTPGVLSSLAETTQ